MLMTNQPDGKGMVVFKVADGLRVAHIHQTFLEEVEAQLLVVRRLVH